MTVALLVLPGHDFFLILLLLGVLESFLSDEFNGRHCCGATICLAARTLNIFVWNDLSLSRVPHFQREDSLKDLCAFVFSSNERKLRIAHHVGRANTFIKHSQLIRFRLRIFRRWETFQLACFISSIFHRIVYTVCSLRIYDNINIFRSIKFLWKLIVFIGKFCLFTDKRVVSIYTV